MFLKNKHVFISLSFLVLASSCKKDYTCLCTINGVSSNSVYEDIKKKDAEEACLSLEATAKFIDANASCSL